MVKSDSFELQARTERAWDSNKQPSDAGTVFGAVAGRAMYEESNETVSTARVHIEMTTDRTTGTIRHLSVPSNCQNLHLFWIGVGGLMVRVSDS